MRFRTGLVVAVLLLAAATTLTQPAERTWAERMWIDERRNYEQWLLTAEIEGLGAVGEGVTNPTKVTLSHDGRVFYAIYKPLKRGRQKGYWESYQAEVAAYALDKMLGLDMVPPTVVRRVSSDLGSLQLWVEGCDTYKRLEPEVPKSPQFSWQISRMKMFDNLIYNEDRNAGNFLLDVYWNVILIDHSRAFLERKNLLKERTKLPSQFDRKLVEQLKSLSEEQLERELDGLLDGGQIESILARRDQILEHMESLIAERGASAVLFN